MVEQADSLVAYYKGDRFNPVLIRVEDEAVWAAHFDKRQNLYEKHLGIPLAYLNGAAVLEFGSNSGENALVWALAGADLTLVEPNYQVLPRLRELFDRFGAAGQIDRLECEGVGEFQSDQLYDLVVAEGFLYTLPDRDAALRKIAGFVRPNRFGVVSFNDRYGSVLEYLRRAYLFRTCELAGVADLRSAASLNLARRLFAADFARLNSSRTFEAWWQDTLINPFCRSGQLWSVPEVLTVLTEEGCEFHTSSPLWATFRHFDWYKNLYRAEARREQVLHDWRCALPYFLTGLRPQGGVRPAPDAVLDAVASLVGRLSDTEVQPGRPPEPPEYPKPLDRFLATDPDPEVREVNYEWNHLFAGLRAGHVDGVLAAYDGAGRTRRLWGTPYQYLCFKRSGRS
jgi:SAM-dependent methyltransferase